MCPRSSCLSSEDEMNDLRAQEVPGSGEAAPCCCSATPRLPVRKHARFIVRGDRQNAPHARARRLLLQQQQPQHATRRARARDARCARAARALRARCAPCGLWHQREHSLCQRSRKRKAAPLPAALLPPHAQAVGCLSTNHDARARARARALGGLALARARARSGAGSSACARALRGWLWRTRAHARNTCVEFSLFKLL